MTRPFDFPAGRTCKPNSVALAAGDACPRHDACSHLSGPSGCPSARAAYPELKRSGAAPLLPIWPCSRWGLPCRTCHQARGELLPRRFTLTSAEAGAVCFLLHFPYPCGRWPLATTVPRGVRTFLPAPGGARRLRCPSCRFKEASRFASHGHASVAMPLFLHL